MFPEGTLFSTKFMKMNEKCFCCGQSFMPEPGYYFGAMFVSYGLNAGCPGPTRDQMLVENKLNTKGIPSGMKCYLLLIV